MDEHEKPEGQEKRLDLNDESGMTRRDMLRRGAIVGGTLLWVAPAIQSMAPRALAAVQGPSPGACSACYCFNGTKGAAFGQCDADGPPTGRAGTGLFSVDECENWCKWQNQYVDPSGVVPAGKRPGAAGGKWQHFEYCSTADLSCGCNNLTGVSCPGGTIHSG
jgi:hypothetical protein